MKKIVYQANNTLPSEQNFTREINFPLKNAENLSLKKEKEMYYEETEQYMCINSSDRNTTHYPKVNNYRVDFKQEFRNVSSIELVFCSLANQNFIINYPYLILEIEGINNMNFTNFKINNGFALLYIKPDFNPHIIPFLQRNFKNFKTPLSSISNLKIRILKPDGTLFDFGEPNGDVSLDFQNSFHLRIITKEKYSGPLQNRAIY